MDYDSCLTLDSWNRPRKTTSLWKVGCAHPLRQIPRRDGEAKPENILSPTPQPSHGRGKLPGNWTTRSTRGWRAGRVRAINAAKTEGSRTR